MILLLYILLSIQSTPKEFLLPIQTTDRKDVNSIHLTQIGAFGVERVARPTIPKHLHSGVDIQRPIQDYRDDQFIYPVASGVVISKRTDGPFAQLIVEHEIEGLLFWTVYEHITSIEVELFQKVNPTQSIARFFNGKELDEIGWQFDHFHFEVLKRRPVELKTSLKNPDRLFNSFTLVCKDSRTLDQHFYNPLRFLEKMINN